MATDLDTARTQYAQYRWCYDNGHDQWVRTARKQFDYWAGRQWDAQDVARLQREGRPHLTLNVVESLIRTAKGVQRALRNDVRFAPVQFATAQSAAVKDALWLHTQSANKMDFLETDVFEKGLIMDRAYYDIRVSYDESMMGHVVVTSPRSQDVILDPSMDVYDPAGWPQVFTRRWVSLNDIEHLFGKDQADALAGSNLPGWIDYEDSFMAQQMGQLPYYYSNFTGFSDDRNVRGLLLLDRQYMVVKNKDVFVDVETGDFKEIPETWDRNRISRVLALTPALNTMKRKVRTVRWTVSCEQETLHDEDSPYKNFTVVPYFPSFVDGETIGAVRSLLDPQAMYNKITSQELHIINTTANSGWKVKRGALQNMTVEELEQVGARSGFVAELDDIGHMEKIQPNSIPQGHDRLSFKADQIMRTLSGISDSGRGFARDDASGDKVLTDQAAQSLNLAGWLSNLHRTKQLVAERVLDCIQATYTETRTILITTGSMYKPDVQAMTINQPTPEGGVLNDVTSGRYTTTLVPSPARAAMSEADFEIMLKLRKEVGIAIPDSMLIELSPASNKGQIVQMLGGDSNEKDAREQELQARERQVAAQLAEARALKEQAAATLNEARAQKARVEAASDPDAAYERVETARIAAESAYNQGRLSLDRERLGATKQHQERQVALRLTELDHPREEAAGAESPERRPAKRREKKPGN